MTIYLRSTTSAEAYRIFPRCSTVIFAYLLLFFVDLPLLLLWSTFVFTLIFLIFNGLFALLFFTNFISVPTMNNSIRCLTISSCYLPLGPQPSNENVSK